MRTESNRILVCFWSFPNDDDDGLEYQIQNSIINVTEESIEESNNEMSRILSPAARIQR